MKSNFSRMPSVTISRSKFLRKSQHKTSLKLGELTPIYVDEVLPGDTRKIDVGSLIRMSTPVAPVMDNIYLDIYAFFVPNRLTWSHWKEFMGENNSSAGIYSGTAYSIPKIDLYTTGVQSGSVADHMGLPVFSGDLTKHLYVSALPYRGYRLIYNRFFRDQNVIAPLSVNLGDTVNSSDTYFGDASAVRKVAKVSDYFTRALPYAQKGAPVSIPLGSTAPIIGASSLHDIGTNLYQFGNTAGTGMANINMAFSGANNHMAEGSNAGGLGADITKSNLVADLSQATAATINQLRFAFQYQKLLEKDALYGTRLTTR